MSRATSAAERLRNVPWLLFAVTAGVIVARLLITGDPPGEVALVVAALAGSLGLSLGLARWLDGRAAAHARGAVLFACTTTIHRALLGPVRFGWITGGWLTGRLEITPERVRWVPGSTARRLNGAAPLEIPWTDVVDVAVKQRVLGLELAGGSTRAFMVMRPDELAGAIARVRTTRSAIVPQRR